MNLCREVTARLMSADDITLVADDTTSQGASSTLTRSVESPDGLESDGKDVLFATRNVGDCVEFEEHIRRFIQDFLPTVARGNECGAGNLIGFVQNIDVQVDKSLCDKWLEVTKKPNQNIFLSTLTEYLMSHVTTHPLWTLSDFKSCTCQKDNATDIFSTDRDAMVQHALSGK